MTEADTLRTKLQRITTTLQRITECTVCLEVLKVPFKLCVIGHGICYGCSEDLEKCPTCKESFSMENPVLLKKLMEALPKFCQYSGDGCQEVLEQEDDHGIYCRFRPVSCKACKVVVSQHQLLDHNKTVHPRKFTVRETPITLRWPNFDPEKIRVDSILVILFDQCFWLTVRNDIERKRFKATFQAVLNGKPMDDYYVCVEFKKDNFVYVHTIKAFVLKSCLTESSKKEEDPSDQKKKNDDDEDEDQSEDLLYSMNVPQCTLNNFIEEGDLRYKLTFFKTNLK